jgi:DNA-directed RNA polymerase specialized sigma24 family protein
LKYQRRSATAYDCLRKTTPEQRSEMVALHASGVSLRELGRRFNISFGSARRAVRNHR